MLGTIQEKYPDGIPAHLRVRFATEPSFNRNTSMFLIRLAEQNVTPVVETILPSVEEDWKFPYLNELVNIINEEYDGRNGIIKFVLGSTSEKTRKTLFGPVRTIADISKAFGHLPKLKNDGKVVLTFYADRPFDITKIRNSFSPTDCAIELKTSDASLSFNYDEVEKSVRSAGYDLYYEDDDD